MLEHLLPRIRRGTDERSEMAARGEGERFVSLLDYMDQLARSGFGAMPSTQTGEALKVFDIRVDVREDDKEIVIAAEVPGMEAKDIDIALDGDSLTIRGEKKFEHEEKKDNFTRVERRYGSFRRSFRLPSAVRHEEVTARYDKGVLTLTLPKALEAQPRKIAIQE